MYTHIYVTNKKIMLIVSSVCEDENNFVLFPPINYMCMLFQTSKAVLNGIDLSTSIMLYIMTHALTVIKLCSSQ